jgi:hypothetical protein
MLPQDKRQELCSLLPQVDQNTFLDHPNNSNEMSFHDTNLAFNNNNNENYHPAYNQSNNFFSKTENPIFWNSLTGWQTMLAHGQFMDQAESPPLPLSPSPPTTTNNSSSNKSTVSSSYRPHKSTKPRSPSSSKKDKFKVYYYIPIICN